jgi:Uncharacterized conserved protein
MEQIFSKLKFITHGEGFIDITYDLNSCVEKNNFHSGILNLTSLHTSCSLTINENADPNVLRDLKKYMQSIVPYDSYLTLSKNREEISYKHYQEGADDMPAHIKNIPNKHLFIFEFSRRENYAWHMASSLFMGTSI